MKKDLKVNIEERLNIPMVPNFIQKTDKELICLKDIEDSILEQIGKAWTENLIERKREQLKMQNANR